MCAVNMRCGESFSAPPPPNTLFKELFAINYICFNLLTVPDVAQFVHQSSSAREPELFRLIYEFPEESNI